MGINLSDPNIALILVTWELIWKGIALWKSAKNDQKYWFIILLVINTVGILPIIYLLYLKFSQKKKK